MKTLLLTFILIFSNFIFSQITANIIDSETSQNIAYVNIWVENENIGTTSDEQGEFILNIKKPKQLIFSAIGYKRFKTNSDLIKDIVKLKPSTVLLNEVIVKGRQNDKEIIIGSFKNKTNISNTSGGLAP